MVGKNKVMPESIGDLEDDRFDQDVMTCFRNSELNCIVCSSVLEEGIDVQECNYVLMFDEIKTFSTYVQTKGRARMQNSSYVVFTADKDAQELVQKIQVYKSMDSRLKSYLIERTVDRQVPSELETAEQFQNEIKPYFSRIGARLESDSVLPLLYRYFNCLPNDSFTTSQAIRWKKIELPPTVMGTKVSLQLPMQSTVKEIIESDIMPNAASAKRSAAMKACIKLYENNELTDHLVPFSTKKVLEDLTQEYFPHWDAFKNESEKIAGTQKNYRTYEKYIPNELYRALPQPNQISYLYEIVMKHEFVPADNKQHLVNAFESDSRFGILSSKKMPALADFPLYMHQGRVTISIRYLGSEVFISSENHFNELKNFHFMLFRDILKVIKYFMACDNTNEENSFLLVPLITLGSKVAINNDLAAQFQTIPNAVIPTLIEKRRKKYVASEWLNKVITPWYSNKDERYMVVKVNEDMSPLTPFPKETYSSYKDYVETAYSTKIERTDMFMVEVKGITSSLRFFSSGQGKGGAKKKSSENFIINFIPEVCHNTMFPADLWVKCKLLPSILHRINSMLAAEKLRISINDFVGVPNHSNYSPRMIQEDSNDGEAEGFNADDSFGSAFLKNDTHLEDLAKDKIPQPIDSSKSLLDSSLIDNNNKYYKRPIDIYRNIDNAYIVDFEYAIAFINQQLPEQMKRMSINQVLTADSDEALQDYRAQRAICDIPREDIKILKIINPKTPEQFEILRAITTRGANDNFNLERVEVLGDSFLKFSISLYLMHQFPTWNEGYLTTMKGKMVSNQNLLYLASVMGLNLPGMIISTQFDPCSEWKPPLFSAPKNLTKIIREKNFPPRTLYDLQLNAEEINSGMCKEETLAYVLRDVEADSNKNSSDGCYFINKQSVADKSVADCVEAIIGTTLMNYGIVKNFDVLRYFGIINANENDPASVLKEKLVNAKIHSNISNSEIDSFLVNYDILEKSINYKFKDRAYLLAALTHPSYPSNRVTGCYQQLEFLGDAVLDFLITCYIVEQNPEMNPGKLTDLRMALVNNVTLGCISVRNDFHKHMLYENAALMQAILRFETFQRDQQFAVSSEIRLIRVEDEYNPAIGDYIDCPKALGDVVESLIGAVFLDSHNDLEVTWQVIYGLLKEEIHKFTANVPIQVVRQLFETPGANPKFNEAVEQDGLFMVKVDFTCRDQRKVASGFGKNSKQAQQSAAKSALAFLKSH